MNNLISAGFQNTVDFELVWNPSILEKLIQHYHIQQNEIQFIHPITSERELIIVLLAHMTEGSGSECLAVSSQITRSFSKHFSYKVTLGGTAVRAAMAIEKIGYRSTVHVCSLNHYFRKLIPDNIDWLASVPDEGENFHPHVIVQYPKNAQICAEDICFQTQRPNRVIFSCDPPSNALRISKNFIHKLTNTVVFLIASYNLIEDPDILNERLQTTIELIKTLPPSHTVIMEDACFQNKHLRKIVTNTLASYINIFSMNEDELQDRLGYKINVLNPSEVATAIQIIKEDICVDTIICHTAYWALAYGNITPVIQNALKNGINMASTHFRLGDNYTEKDFLETDSLKELKAGISFSKELEDFLPPLSFVCIPCKDLSYVKIPTTIGLGDAFVGGMLPAFVPEQQRKDAKFI